MPISGYEEGLISIKFVILPVIIGVLSGLGASTRWYRTIFLEEINNDYADCSGEGPLRCDGNVFSRPALPSYPYLPVWSWYCLPFS